MGIIGGVAAALASIVGSVVATVATLVAVAVAAATIAISSVIATVTAVIGSIVSSVTSAFSAEVLHTTIEVNGVVIPFEIAEASMFANLTAWIVAVGDSFSAFLAAIQFETIISIHEIAYITSSAYRDMMNKVYGELGEFSQAIGRSTGFIETAIQLARRTSLNVSALLGKPYDLAEVVWLQDFQGLLERINNTANAYANNPSQIWNDIDDLIMRPAINAQAEAQNTMYTTVRNIIDMARTLDDTIVTIQDDFNEVLDDLPARWRNDIFPYVDRVSEEIDSWRDNIFTPTINTIDEVVDVVFARTIQAREIMQEIQVRLSRAGYLLADIDKLPEAERLEQERIIAEISTRYMRRSNDNWLRILEEHDISLESIREGIRFELPPELFFTPPRRPPTIPVGRRATIRATWFVGDY